MSGGKALAYAWQEEHRVPVRGAGQASRSLMATGATAVWVAAAVRSGP